jgi:putative flippase GtrA
MRLARGGQHELPLQILRFVLVGTGGYLVNAGIAEAIAPFWGPVIAQYIAFPAAVAFTWLMNRRYTFGPSPYGLFGEAWRYLAFNTVGWIFNNLVYFWLVFQYPPAYAHPAIAAAGGSIAGMVFNFLSSRMWTFANKGEA